MQSLLFDTKVKSQQLCRAEVRARLAGSQHALFLHHIIAEDMGDRLSMFRADFLDIAVLRGLGLNWSAMLGEKFKQARIQIFQPPLELRAFPIEPASQDLILAPLWLHWVNDVPEMLLALRLALKPGGLLIGSMFGGECLIELRQCLTEAEENLFGGVAPRFSPSMELRTLAELLQKAGFEVPVVDVDKHQVQYPDAFKLMRDLSDAGEGNALTSRTRRFSSSALFRKAAQIYEERFSKHERLLVTCDVLHFSGSVPGDLLQRNSLTASP